MGQNTASYVAKAIGGALAFLGIDPGGNLLSSGGGRAAVLNVTTVTGAGLVGLKGSAGRIHKIVVITAPSASNLTLNDLGVNTGAAAANVLFDQAFGALTKGLVITLDMPFVNGLVISSIGTGGVYAITYS